MRQVEVLGSSMNKVATIADLYRVPGKAELVNGEIVHMSPATAGHGRSSGRIFQGLYEYEQRT
jgi:hypothetical protein